MFFILLLIASTIAIAGSAAYFSVYGLANTFSGVFWSVVIMGGALEAGKLVAASYLYRHWKETHALLKSYMMAGIFALMLLTSGGIFGYLSSGYQTDVLPLRQLNSQIKILEEEKERKLVRKVQIDGEMAKLPTPNLGSIDFSDPRATDAATRALAQTQRMRDAATKVYLAEQQQVTKRINELDKDLLELRQKQIKTEAHVGPIIYIASAFNVETDQATKWLVFLIIFAFDPMALALTLAVNVVLRLREERTTAGRQEASRAIVEKMARQPQPEPQIKIVEKEVIREVPVEVIKEVIKEVPVEVVKEVIKEVIREVPVEKIVYVKEDVPSASASIVEPQKELRIRKPTDVFPLVDPTVARGYTGHWIEGAGSREKIETLLAYYRALEEKQTSGKPLTSIETQELADIKEIFKKKGYDVYLST